MATKATGGEQVRARRRDSRAGVAVAALLATLATLAPLAQAAAAVPGGREALGLNLAEWAYYSPDLPLIDQFKRSSGWLTQCEPERDPGCRQLPEGASAWDTREQAKLELDAQGWPRRLPGADDSSRRFRTVAVLLFHGNGRAHPAGKYVVTYEGKGRLVHDLIGRKIESESRPGRDVVEVSNHTDAGWRIAIHATDPADPLRQVRVLPPGGACERALDRHAEAPASCDPAIHGAFVPFEHFPPGRLWHPRFLQDLRGFRALRFMDWAKTNHSPVQRWAERPQPDAATWAGEGGVPWEAMLDLAGAAGADPWLTLPMRADDDYVRQFARLLRARLPAGRQAIVEYANEPWNQAFPIAGWLRQQAQAQWPTAAQDGMDAAVNWHAWRAARICQLVKAAWEGGAAPVRCVLNTHVAQPGLAAQALACPLAAAALGGPCARHLDVLAVAPYFGGYLADPALRPLIGGWLQEPDGGLDTLFRELLAEGPRGEPASAPFHGRPEAVEGGALASARALVRTMRILAARHGLPLWAYEGGQHLTLPHGGGEDPALQTLITRANRDPRMARAYQRHLADWRAAGGELYVFFNHIAQPSRYGAWGLKETQFRDDSVKWQAVTAARDGLACWWPGCGR